MLRRHVLAAHHASVRDTVRFVTNRLTQSKRCLHFGLTDDMTVAGLVSLLRDPTHMLTVFVTGNHPDELKTLKTVSDAGVSAPFGVVLCSHNDTIWKELPAFKGLQYICNVGAVELARWHTVPWLFNAGNALDLPPTGIPQFLDLMASRPFGAVDLVDGPASPRYASRQRA